MFVSRAFHSHLIFLCAWSFSSFIFYNRSLAAYFPKRSPTYLYHRRQQLSPQIRKHHFYKSTEPYKSWEPRAVSGIYSHNRQAGKFLRMDNSAASSFRAHIDFDSAFAYMCWVHRNGLSWLAPSPPLPSPAASPPSTYSAYKPVSWPPQGRPSSWFRQIHQQVVIPTPTWV